MGDFSAKLGLNMRLDLNPFKFLFSSFSTFTIAAIAGYSINVEIMAYAEIIILFISSISAIEPKLFSTISLYTSKITMWRQMNKEKKDFK